jgi:hypothetical protein
MTTKQEEARQNNWRIHQLRGCWATIDSLPITKLNKQLALGAVDEILKELGADTELVHREKERSKVLNTSDK